MTWKTLFCSCHFVSYGTYRQWVTRLACKTFRCAILQRSRECDSSQRSTTKTLQDRASWVQPAIRWWPVRGAQLRWALHQKKYVWFTLRRLYPKTLMSIQTAVGTEPGFSENVRGWSGAKTKKCFYSFAFLVSVTCVTGTKIYAYWFQPFYAHWVVFLCLSSYWRLAHD